MVSGTTNGGCFKAESLLKVLDLYDEELFLVAKLLICITETSFFLKKKVAEKTRITPTFFIVMERFQKIEKFLLVPPKNTFDLRRFFRICDKHLAYHSKFNENMYLNLIKRAEKRKLTLNTWKASNWMFLLLSRSRFIIIFKLASLAM